MNNKCPFIYKLYISASLVTIKINEELFIFVFKKFEITQPGRNT